MEMKTGLFLAVGLIPTCVWAQTAPQSPAELQPGYPGYPASNASPIAIPVPAPQQVQPLPEMTPGTGSSGAYPAPTHSGNPDSNAPQMEVRPLPGTPVKPLSPPAPMTRVEPITENGITYLCGGVGLDEADRMKREALNYDLMLTFAARDGSYLADVNIDVADARGQSLLKASCGGPMMLLELPKSGNYRIRAETGGRTITRTVQVRDAQHGKAVTMVWPSEAGGSERLKVN